MQDAQIAVGALAQRFAMVYSPLLLLMAAVLVFIYQTQTSALTELTELDEQQTTALAARDVGQGLASVRGDIRFLAVQPALRDLLQLGGEPQRRRLEENYRAFAAAKGHYDQVRFTDEQGHDVVRIDQRDGRFRGMPAAELAARGVSRYTGVIQALSPGEVFISPFELNVEQGVLEQPIKPVIRFVTAVHDAEGRRRGAVMLNYMGDRLIGLLKALKAPAAGQVWLVNDGGHWLAGPRPQDEWGFMFADQPRASFASTYPAAWMQMSGAGGRGQHRSEHGLLTYLAITPRQLVNGDFTAAGPGIPGTWYFVSFVPAALLDAPLRTLRQQLVIAAVILAVALAVAAWAAAYASLRRRRAELAEVAARERYEQLVNNLNVGVYRITTGDDGRFVEANAALLRMLRVGSKEELVRRPVKQFYANPEAYAQLSRELMEKGAIADNVAEGVRADGERFWGALTAVKKTEADGSIYFDGIVSDVTARQAAETALRDSEFKFRSLLESGPDAIVMIDTAGRIMLANAQAERLFGYAREELMGKPIEILLPRELREGHVRHRHHYMQAPTARPMGAVLDLHALHKDGRRIPIDVSLSPMETHSGMAAIASVRDVTQRKQAELEIKALNRRLASHVTELTAVNNELEAFSYSVSHDLRAPLRSIDGFSQALLEEYSDRIDEVGQDYLRRVCAASQYMAQLIDDLLLLSRITRAEMSRESVDLTAIAREIVADLARAAPQRTVEWRIEEGLVAQGDARLLRIALTNLLDNAWKFTSKRTAARIEIGQAQTPRGPAYFIRDNGAGFNMAYADKLFGVFQRLHSAEEFVGSGVGLAIVQRVIHRHGGKAWAESVVDAGATFYFTLADLKE